MQMARHRYSGVRLTLLAAVSVLGLVACASTPPATAARPPPASGNSGRITVQHYPLALGEISTGAVLREHPSPVYPPSLLDAQLPPEEVQARLVVDTQGRTREVQIAGELAADPQRKLFDEAVRDATLQWTFDPQPITQWAADANGNTHQVGSEARPFGMDLLFRFAWKNGQPAVDVSALTTPTH